jgi:serine/threonine-protein kinase RsbT
MLRDPAMGPDLVVPIHDEPDIVVARQRGRTLAAELGFSAGDLALIATAISELTRNVLSYAKAGELSLRVVAKGARRGVEVVVRDHGPGIPDLALAMQDGYSTGGGLGLGLPGARRLMDEFQIESKVGRGTTVTMRKWTR